MFWRKNKPEPVVEKPKSEVTYGGQKRYCTGCGETLQVQMVTKRYSSKTGKPLKVINYLECPSYFGLFCRHDTRTIVEKYIEKKDHTV